MTAETINEISLIIERARQHDEGYLIDSKQAAVTIVKYLAAIGEIILLDEL